MLRRPPTTITLTSTDIELYEANRQRKLWEKQQQQGDADAQTSSQSSNGVEKGKEKASKPTQKDRIMGGQTRRDQGKEVHIWIDEDALMDGEVR